MYGSFAFTCNKAALLIKCTCNVTSQNDITKFNSVSSSCAYGYKVALRPCGLGTLTSGPWQFLVYLTTFNSFVRLLITFCFCFCFIIILRFTVKKILLIKRKAFYRKGSCFHVKQRKAFAKWFNINSRFMLLSCETEESISTMFYVFQGLTFFLKSIADSFDMLLKRLPAIEVLFSTGTFVMRRV